MSCGTCGSTEHYERACPDWLTPRVLVQTPWPLHTPVTQWEVNALLRSVPVAVRSVDFGWIHSFNIYGPFRIQLPGVHQLPPVAPVLAQATVDTTKAHRRRRRRRQRKQQRIAAEKQQWDLLQSIAARSTIVSEPLDNSSESVSYQLDDSAIKQEEEETTNLSGLYDRIAELEDQIVRIKRERFD